MPKSVSVDWYSFTTWLRSENDNPETMLEVATNSLEYHLGRELFTHIFTRSGWEVGNGRRPYKGGWVNSEQGVRVWYGGQPTVLVEFSGHGCKWLREHYAIDELIALTYDRCTRIDIAVDIDSGGLVDEIADSAGNNRFKTTGRNESPTGYTRYIGARKSEKMVRVYEYYEPHPRSGTTRVEYEHKKKQARITAGWLTQMSTEDVADSIGKIYDWRHEEMKPNEYVPKMSSPISEQRTDASRIRWIYKQVAPAVKQLIREGKISDPMSWLVETFIPEDWEDMDGNRQQNFLDKLD